MDVHPPLAKLLITFAAWFAGFRGNFDFKDIGKYVIHVFVIEKSSHSHITETMDLTTFLTWPCDYCPRLSVLP